jgi:hypothetical protein
MLSGYLYDKAEELLREKPGSNYFEIGSYDGEGIAKIRQQ